MFLYKDPLKTVFFISFILACLCSYFSIGFHHYDEHFQILEFLNFKWGEISSDVLPWEFKERLRPWFQVFLYYCILYPFKFLGLKNPFVFDFILRFFTSLLHLLSLISLFPYLKRHLKDQKLLIYSFVLLNFLWFVPYYHARLSAESMAGAFFVLGFSFYLYSLEEKNKKALWNSFLSGIFFGASYLSKYQLAICVMFLWFWSLAFKRNQNTKILLCALGIALMIFLGPIIDFWGYGEWAFAPWNYFDVNILQGRASNYGVDPWWYYFEKILIKGIPPLSLYLFLGLGVFCVKKWKHPLTWIILPFFVAHLLISHKELRFLFPLIPFIPLIIIFTYQDYPSFFPRKFVSFCLFLNALLLFVILFRPAHSALSLYREVYQHDIKKLYYKEVNPYQMTNLQVYFYRPMGLELIQKNEIHEGYIFRSNFQDYQMIKEKGCKIHFLNYPSWLIKRNDFSWASRSRIWSLSYCSFEQ